MTEYEKIRNELVGLGWAESQGRGDHRKFTKEGMRPISVSMSISDNSRAFKNACANIRKVEPAFSLGKTVLGKDKEKQRQVQQRVQERLSSLTEEQKIFRQAYSFVHVGAKVRYTSPEGYDWSLLDKPGSVMNVPYIVKEMDGAYVSSPENNICIEEEGNPNNISIVTPEDLDSWETVECNYCHRRLPLSRTHDKESFSRLFGTVSTVDLQPAARKAMDRFFSFLFSKGRICSECSAELREGFAASSSDMAKGRIDIDQADYGKALPAELAGKYGISPEGELVFPEDVPLKDRARIVLDYEPWLMRREAKKAELMKAVQKSAQQVREPKPTLYALWGRLRGNLAQLYTDTPGLGELSYELKKVRKIHLFEVKVHSAKQYKVLAQAKEDIYDILSKAAPENTFLRIHCEEEKFDWIVPQGNDWGESMELETLRANLPGKDYERMLEPVLQIMELPSDRDFIDVALETIEILDDPTDRLFTKEPPITYFATARIENRCVPVALLLIHCDNGRQYDLLKRHGDEFRDNFMEILYESYPCRIPYGLTVYARDFSTLDPSETLDYERLLQDENAVCTMEINSDAGGGTEARIRDVVDDTCPEWVRSYLVQHTDDGEWGKTFVTAMSMYVETMISLFKKAGELNIPPSEVMTDNYVVHRYCGTSSGVHIVPCSRIEHILNNDNMTETQSRTEAPDGGLAGYETRELLKELKRRGVTMENVKVPVVQYEQVDMEEL